MAKGYESDVRSAIAKGLTALRAEAGIGPTEAARALGVSRMQLRNWEHGTATPSATNLVGLAALYDADLTSLAAPAVEKARAAIGGGRAPTTRPRNRPNKRRG